MSVTLATEQIKFTSVHTLDDSHGKPTYSAEVSDAGVSEDNDLDIPEDSAMATSESGDELHHNNDTGEFDPFSTAYDDDMLDGDDGDLDYYEEYEYEDDAVAGGQVKLTPLVCFLNLMYFR